MSVLYLPLYSVQYITNTVVTLESMAISCGYINLHFVFFFSICCLSCEVVRSLDPFLFYTLAQIKVVTLYIL